MEWLHRWLMTYSVEAYFGGRITDDRFDRLCDDPGRGDICDIAATCLDDVAHGVDFGLQTGHNSCTTSKQQQVGTI